MNELCVFQCLIGCGDDYIRVRIVNNSMAKQLTECTARVVVTLRNFRKQFDEIYLSKLGQVYVDDEDVSVIYYNIDKVKYQYEQTIHFLGFSFLRCLMCLKTLGFQICLQR